MATTNTRQANRSPVTLKIKFKSATLDQFIERYSVDISHGGIFIRTKEPLPVGTTLRFEFQLKDASPLITGDGTVVWTREFDPSRSGVAPGMGVRFDRLPNDSQEVLDKILAHKNQRLGGRPGEGLEPSFLNTPTRVAPADSVGGFGDIPTRVTPSHLLKDLAEGADPRRTLLGVAPASKDSDNTPLPRPLPFHSDLDEFPDEAFEEATKVASLDALARRSAEADDGHGRSPFDSSMDDDVTVQRSRRPSRPGEDERAEGKMPPASLFALGTPPEAREAMGENRADTEFDPDSQDDAGGLYDDRIDPMEAERDDGMDPEETVTHTEPARAEPIPALSNVRGVEDPERDGSSLPWIAAAALLLVVGGIGGFWLMRDRNQKADAAAAGQSPHGQQTQTAAGGTAAATQPAGTNQAGAGDSQAAGHSTAADQAGGDQTAAAAATPTGVDATVTSTPAGATAQLVGESQSGATPMTFHGLVKGKHYTVRIGQAGFLDKEASFTAGKDKPVAVKLEAKPVVLHVTSDPPGAAVYLDGKRQRHLTPADIPLKGRLADKKEVRLALRKSGYSGTSQRVELAGAVEQSDKMVRDVTFSLERRQIARTQPSGGSSHQGGSTSSHQAGDGSKAGGGGDAGSGGDAAATAGGDQGDTEAAGAGAGAAGGTSGGATEPADKTSGGNAGGNESSGAGGAKTGTGTGAGSHDDSPKAGGATPTGGSSDKAGAGKPAGSKPTEKKPQGQSPSATPPAGSKNEPTPDWMKK